MLSQYAVIAVLFLGAFVFAGAAIVLSRIFQPRKPYPKKSETYECGFETQGSSWISFRASYFIYALVYLVFEVEIVFLYPWAVEFGNLGLFAIFEMFIFFAILIACLGLYGLVSFITERRSNEIGIRKVYGASIITIIFLITKDITKWIAVAFVIACPIGYWITKQWLSNFAFQSSMPWWIYAITGLLGLFIGLFTLSFEAYKAAVKNPLDSLNYE